jgi:multiple sugar transport system substrate-binding protein
MSDSNNQTPNTNGNNGFATPTPMDEPFTQPEPYVPAPVQPVTPAPIAEPVTPYSFDQITPEPVTPSSAYGTSFDGGYNNGATSKPARKFNRKLLLPLGMGIAGILVIGVVLVLLATRGQNQQTTAQNVVLQWWGVFMSEEAVQPLLDEYKTLKPNVTVEYANRWPDAPATQASTRYRTELNRVLNENDQVQIPDIFMVNNTWVGDYEDYVKPNTSISIDDFNSTYYPAASDNFTNNNIIYGLPLWMDPYAIIYNEDMLLADSTQSVPPTDWPTFKSLAQRLTKKSGNGAVTQAGFAAGTSNNVSFSSELANLLLLQNGVNINNDDVLTFADDADSVTAINFYKDFAAQNGNTWDEDMKNDSAAFLEEKVAMIFAPSYRYRDILKYKELYEITFNVDVAEVPQLTGQGVRDTDWVEYWGNMVSLSRPNSTAAWEFLNWLNQPEQLKKLSENVKTAEGFFGLLSPREDMADEAANDQYLSVFNKALPTARSWYMSKGLEVRSAFNDLIDERQITSATLTNTQEDLQAILDTKGTLE